MGNLRFTKMHGCGNDYIYINCFEEQVEDPAALAVRLSRPAQGHWRRRGDPDLPPRTRPTPKCACSTWTAAREKCAATASAAWPKYVYDHHIAHKEELRIETLSGMKTCRVHEENGQAVSITVDMGDAVLNPAEIPVNLPGRAGCPAKRGGWPAESMRSPACLWATPTV